ncbi:hypothetical protein [Sphingobium sp.]|uniref:hypothetical protein n=1 Tax=Sphingobium sp. TaxID=1912891 RepID=UPI0028BE502D|nr:hypothetical protein [Sphingobium sp.]
MRGWTLLLGTMALLCGAPAMAQADPFGGARMAADGELDAIRGGFLLPNGMDIGLGIMIETMIDGRPALSTVLTIDDSAHLAIYTGGGMERHASVTELLVPGPNGTSLIRITQDAPSTPGASNGQPIAILPNGPAVDTPWGAVHLVQSDTQSTVVLAGNGLELQQMIGTVTGALVTNTASDRVIDTMVTVDLDIRHSAIPTSAMMLRLDSLLAGAAARGGY